MRKTDPTPDQLRALESFGVIPPKTRVACTGLISYLLKDEGGIGNRVASLKAMQKKFLGKRIISQTKRTGTVRHVMANPFPGRYKKSPFDLMVDWDNGIVSSTSLFGITLL